MLIINMLIVVEEALLYCRAKPKEAVSFGFTQQYQELYIKFLAVHNRKHVEITVISITAGRFRKKY